MYYKEFPVMFDWLHNGEGLTVFDLQGLSDPNDQSLPGPRPPLRRLLPRRRPRRAELRSAPQDHPQHVQRQPRPAAAEGDRPRLGRRPDRGRAPLPVRCTANHSYKQMLAHFEKYNDIVGDNPINLESTSLAFNAYRPHPRTQIQALAASSTSTPGSTAWSTTAASSPRNVGLDGRIGSGAGGKWYGGVYGWGFTVLNPATGKLSNRNQHQLAVTGFGNAFLLTGDAKYLDAWRNHDRRRQRPRPPHRGPDDVPHDVRRQRLVRLHAARSTRTARCKSGTGR